MGHAPGTEVVYRTRKSGKRFPLSFPKAIGRRYQRAARSKKPAYIVANCQTRPLELALESSKSFSERFDLVRIPPVHVIPGSAVERLHRDLPSAGLLVAQSVSEAYRNGIGLGSQTLKSLLSSDALAITWPSIYWPGYNPELFYLKDENGVSFTEGFDYHHRPVFDGYVSGENPDALADSLFHPSRFEADRAAADAALSQLAAREASLDINVAEFIATRYRAERLFWTFNHPAQSVILHVARQILRILELPDDLAPEPAVEPLSSTVYPILPSVRAALGIDFATDEHFVVRGAPRTPRELVRDYYSLYDRRPDLVAINRH